jgi:hypothetical protein
MVKCLLMITAELENLTNLEPQGGCDDPNFSYFFKVSISFFFKYSVFLISCPNHFSLNLSVLLFSSVKIEFLFSLVLFLFPRDFIFDDC